MQGQMAESAEKPAKSRSEHKHRSIQQAGTDIFLQRGYGAATMDMIAAEAGVSKQTVYNHFQSKEGLFKAAIGELTSALLAPLVVRDAAKSTPEQEQPRPGRHFSLERGDRRVGKG